MRGAGRLSPLLPAAAGTSLRSASIFLLIAVTIQKLEFKWKYKILFKFEPYMWTPHVNLSPLFSLCLCRAPTPPEAPPLLCVAVVEALPVFPAS